jgi:hypothetical protein
MHGRHTHDVVVVVIDGQLRQLLLQQPSRLGTVVLQRNDDDDDGPAVLETNRPLHGAYCWKESQQRTFSPLGIGPQLLPSPPALAPALASAFALAFAPALS